MAIMWVKPKGTTQRSPRMGHMWPSLGGAVGRQSSVYRNSFVCVTWCRCHQFLLELVNSHIEEEKMAVGPTVSLQSG